MIKTAAGLLLICLTVLSWLAFGSPQWFRVKKIECRLNAYPCPLDLEPALLNFMGRNIFSLNQKAVVNQISAFDPVLTEIKVKKRLPGRLDLALFRRQPIVKIVLQPEGGEFYLDKTGFVYPAEGGLSSIGLEADWPSALPLSGPDGSVDLAKLINTLAAYYVNAARITRLEEPAYLIKTALGPEAIILSGIEFAPKVATLQYILSNIKMGEKSPARIDLRFDKPVLAD